MTEPKEKAIKDAEERGRRAGLERAQQIATHYRDEAHSMGHILCRAMADDILADIEAAAGIRVLEVK